MLKLSVVKLMGMHLLRLTYDFVKMISDTDCGETNKDQQLFTSENFCFYLVRLVSKLVYVMYTRHPAS